METELDYKAIGKRVKTARVQNRKTQDELAELTGLSNPHISNIETGNTKVSLPTLLRIANALEVSADDLLCDNLLKAKSVFENEITDIAKDCSEVEIRLISDTLKALKTSMRERLHTDSVE